MTIIILAIALTMSTYLAVDAGKDEAQEMMYEVKGSIFSLYGEKSRGTGWAARTKKGKKVIVTNDHVCGKNKTMFTQKGAMSYNLAVIYKDPSHDICLLEAPKNAETLRLAEDVYKEEKAFSIGFPAIEWMSSQAGRIKGIETTRVDYEDTPLEDCVGVKFMITTIKRKGKPDKKICIFSAEALVTTIQIDGGASGSPILNSDEEVIGMTMARAGNINWAQGVPLNRIKNVLNKH